MHLSWIAKAVCRCGMLGDVKGEPLQLKSEQWCKGSHMPLHGVRLCIYVRLCWERVVPGSLRVCASAERWMVQGMGCTEPY